MRGEKNSRVHPRWDMSQGDLDTPSADRLLDVQAAADMLSLKRSTLYQWAYERRIPVVKLFGPRGALRFRLSDIQALVARSLRPALRLGEENI